MTTTTNSSTQSTSSDGQENLLKRLIKAHNEENLTLFIGAGISRCVIDSKAMLWSEAVARMQEKLNIQENDPLRLAQLFYQQFPEEYNEFVHSMIDSTAQPSAVHMMIAQLHPKIIITTNWDCLIEKSVVNSLLFYDIITCDEELLLSKSPYKIIKMHGDFARNDERFVFKEDDYLNYSQNYPLIETFIKNVLITSNILFLGYSYSDINIKMIMTWLKQNKKTANLPLYVMTEFTENQSQIKYLQNWGLETYICKNTTDKSKSLYLPKDEKNRAQKIYTLLECIYFGMSNLNDILGSILNKIEPYKNLSALPFSLITSLIKGSNIKCDEFGNPILNIMHAPDDILTSRLISQLKNESNNNINKLKIFLQKAGIINISDNHLSNISIPTNLLFEKTDNNQFYLDNVKDIQDYLSFKIISFDRHYDISYHNQLIQESLKSGNISTAFIELFNLNVHKLFSLPENKHNTFPKITIDDVFNNLPDNLKTIYKTFISSIKFDDIKNKTKKLYESIEKKKNQIVNQTKGTISFDNTDSFISRSEHLNFLRFTWMNNLCFDYYSEVKEFVYHSIILLYHILIFHKIPLHLKRFELSSILHFLDKNQINKIFNGETYSLENKPLQINIEEEDILWLILEVLPNLQNLYITKTDNSIWDMRWEPTIGNVFIILSHVNPLSEKNINELLNFLVKSDLITQSNPYIFLESLFVFLQKQHNLLQTCCNLNPFLQEIKRKYIVFAGQYDVTNPFNQRTSNLLLSILALFKDDVPIFWDDDNFTKNFISKYTTFDWRIKCQLLTTLNIILALSPEHIRKEQLNILKNHINNISEANPPIPYYIYKSYLILFDILSLDKHFLQEIHESQSIHESLEGAGNSDIEWLRSLFSQIIKTHPKRKLSQELKLVLDTFVYKHPNPFVRI